jgi:hypothetical protein
LKALESKLNRRSREPLQQLAAAGPDCQATSGEQKGQTRFSRLIVQLKDLEKINQIHMRHIDWLRAAVLQRTSIRLPTLFSEIFDIQCSSRSSTASSGCELSSCSPLASRAGSESPLGFLDGPPKVPAADQQQQQLAMVAYSQQQLTATDAPNKLAGDGLQLAAAPDLLDASMAAHPIWSQPQDMFFDLDDSDDKIDDEADLTPTVDCLNVGGL